MNLEVYNKEKEKLEVVLDGEPLETARKILAMTHGFGTNLHERGLNDEIVDYLLKNIPHITIVRFSWSGFGESKGKQEETTILKVKDDLCSVLRYVMKNKPKYAEVVAFAFSMGNIALARALEESTNDISTVIITNPADFKEPTEFREKWLKRPGSFVDDDGIMNIPRADGTVTRLGELFWSDFCKFSYKDDLTNVAKKYNSVLIRATDDEIVKNDSLESIEFKKVYSIHGNHNFSKPEDRKIFLQNLKEVLTEKNTIVDENDNVIGAKLRDEITSKDIYRVSSLWLRNNQGQVLLAQRAFTKSHDPGKWGPAVAGTVSEGEDYFTTILRETEEEIGLTDLVFEEGPKKLQKGEYHYWSQKYFAVTDKDISDMNIQKDEVAAVQWFDESTLPELIKTKPDMFITTMQKYYTD